MEFEVWFMASAESDRDWRFEDSDFRFPHRFLGGRSFRIGSSNLYWNTEITQVLRKTSPYILLVAGAWVHPTVLQASLSSIPVRKIFWSESHFGSIRRASFAVNSARRWMFSRFSEFAVPGELATNYVMQLSPAARIHDLPNIVDPAVFHDEVVMHRRAGELISVQSQNSRVLLIVARLSEEKGILPFLEATEGLDLEDRHRLTVLIAGSGPLRKVLTQWIGRHSLDIRLLGYREQWQIAELYARADGFCLPSISDPNPISVIEALWAGLPLLLSSRVGNHPECLKNGKNGFLFDSDKPESIAQAIWQWLGQSYDELKTFSENSLEIARSGFDPDTAISNFLDQVLAGSISHPQSQFASTMIPR